MLRRMWLSILAAGLVFSVVASVFGATDVAANGAWKVWDKQEAPAAGWEKNEFDDGAWSAVGTRPGQATIYLRRTFNAATPAADTAGLEFTIPASAGGGLAAYLNGVLIERRWLPENFTHDTKPNNPGYTSAPIPLIMRGVDPKLLRGGKNVLAVTLRRCDEDIRYGVQHVWPPDGHLIALSGQDNAFIVGPIVGGAYDNKATVTLQTRLPSSVALKYGKEGSAKGKSVAAKEVVVPNIGTTGNATVYELDVEGLDPNTLYAYDVEATRTGGAEVVKYADGRFRTLPNKPREFTFGVWGDSQYNTNGLWGTASGMMKTDKDIEFAIGLGDYCDGGVANEMWQERFFTPARDFFATKHVWLAAGNHDCLWDNGVSMKYYFAHFPSLGTKDGWYTFTYGSARFVYMHIPMVTQQYNPVAQQIKKTLSEAKEPYLFLYEHGPFWGDDNWENWEKCSEITSFLEKCKVTACFVGHIHFYRRDEKDGVAYIVSGGGGNWGEAVWKNPGPYVKLNVPTSHYCRVKVGPDKAVLEAVSTDKAVGVGKVFDRCEMKPRN